MRFHTVLDDFSFSIDFSFTSSCRSLFCAGREFFHRRGCLRRRCWVGCEHAAHRSGGRGAGVGAAGWPVSSHRGRRSPAAGYLHDRIVAKIAPHCSPTGWMSAPGGHRLRREAAVAVCPRRRLTGSHCAHAMGSPRTRLEQALPPPSCHARKLDTKRRTSLRAVRSARRCSHHREGAGWWVCAAAPPGTRCALVCWSLHDV